VVRIIAEEKKKRKISVTINLKNKTRLNDWQKLGYSSQSDMVNSILTEYFAREDLKKEMGKEN
jgi:metal-responsive CopG/Arc/MetJ family transcriptional regulator